MSNVVPVSSSRPVCVCVCVRALDRGQAYTWHYSGSIFRSGSRQGRRGRRRRTGRRGHKGRTRRTHLSQSACAQCPTTRGTHRAQRPRTMPRSALSRGLAQRRSPPLAGPRAVLPLLVLLAFVYGGQRGMLLALLGSVGVRTLLAHQHIIHLGPPAVYGHHATAPERQPVHHDRTWAQVRVCTNAARVHGSLPSAARPLAHRASSWGVHACAALCLLGLIGRRGDDDGPASGGSERSCPSRACARVSQEGGVRKCP
jgi:hypothetical protein